MYRCAIIGCGGGLARGHAAAYRHIKRAQLVAISTRSQEKLDAFGQEFGIEARYTDYRQMLAQEKPDLVHINTPPDVRLEIFAAAEDAGIPALIVEKPLALQGEDFLEMQHFARNCRCALGRPRDREDGMESFIIVKIARHENHFNTWSRFLQLVGNLPPSKKGMTKSVSST